MTVPAFFSARADWKTTPGGAGTVTRALFFHSSVEFLTTRRNGYASPGLTQPIDETNEFSSRASAPARARHRGGAVAGPAARGLSAAASAPTNGVESV